MIARCCLLALLLVRSLGVDAAEAPIIPPPPNIEARSYLLIDARTDKVLVEQDSRIALPPASLTKIMTSFIAAEELASGRITLDDSVPVSVKAWKTPGSRMFIKEGTEVRLEDLLRGVIIQSGNDASVAIAEHIAGSEDAFADMMNQQALLLGMHDSQFANATGLPAEGHQTSAADLALLTKALINRYPNSYSLYAEKSFTYNDIEQPNRNRLLWRDSTVDGVKTGHTDAAGYCLVASAERNGMRLISVVMGTKDDSARMRESQKLLSYGFRYFETRTLFADGEELHQQDLWYGEDVAVALGVSEAVTVTFPRGHYDKIQADVKVPKLLEAPLAAGAEVGEFRLLLAGETIYRAPLVTLNDAPEGGMFSRFGDFVALFFKSLLE